MRRFLHNVFGLHRNTTGSMFDLEWRCECGATAWAPHGDDYVIWPRGWRP